jgi:hypothetical protein
MDDYKSNIKVLAFDNKFKEDNKEINIFKSNKMLKSEKEIRKQYFVPGKNSKHTISVNVNKSGQILKKEKPIRIVDKINNEKNNDNKFEKHFILEKDKFPYDEIKNHIRPKSSYPVAGKKIVDKRAKSQTKTSIEKNTK